MGITSPPDASWAQRVRWVRSCGALLLVLGCSDTPTDPFVPTAHARFDGLLDGAPFSARAEARIKETPGAPDSLYLLARRRLDTIGTTQTVLIRVELMGVGTYVLGESQVRLNDVEGGDVSVERYVGSSPSPGALILSEIGGRGDPVVGEVHFWLTPSEWALPGSVPIQFTEGTFTARLGAPFDAF